MRKIHMYNFQAEELKKCYDRPVRKDTEGILNTSVG